MRLYAEDRTPTIGSYECPRSGGVPLSFVMERYQASTTSVTSPELTASSANLHATLSITRQHHLNTTSYPLHDDDCFILYAPKAMVLQCPLAPTAGIV